MRATVVVLSMLVLSGCHVSENSATEGLRSFSGVDSSAVLAIAGKDTIRLVLEHGRRLVWTTRVGERSFVRWQSRDLYSAVPTVLLGDFNRDQFPDLFWTMDYEELVGGMLLLGEREAATEVWASDEPQCRAPELQRGNDGAYFLIVHEPGGIPFPLCRSDASMQRCVEAVPSDWDRFGVVEGSGVDFDDQRTRALYAEAAARFAVGRDVLRDAGEQLGCPDDLDESIRAMEIRALALAGGMDVHAPSEDGGG